MEENPYQSPTILADKPKRPVNWFRVALLPYVAAALATNFLVDYLTAHTRYNDRAGSIVIWGSILGGVALWHILSPRK
jgi:hypothetical protein